MVHFMAFHKNGDEKEGSALALSSLCMDKI